MGVVIQSKLHRVGRPRQVLKLTRYVPTFRFYVVSVTKNVCSSLCWPPFSTAVWAAGRGPRDSDVTLFMLSLVDWRTPARSTPRPSRLVSPVRVHPDSR